ncbi:LPS assembly lipoprotein LptE, partial [Francisellaceae bacterium]|nr:LPS assembly lipoprotein LptE [Francisellaceae bacterium]
VLLLTALVTLLVGCGFQLKGVGNNAVLPPVLQKIYVQTSRNAEYAFARTLTSTLKANGAEVVKTPNEATATIEITQIQERSQALNMTGGMSAGQYDQYYSVSYQVKDSNGDTLQAPLTISAHDTYSTNAAQQLSINNKIKGIIERLSQQVAENIVSQLQVIKTKASTILPQGNK